MKIQQLTGSVKVAILMKTIGIHAVRPILERLSDEERSLIYILQSKLGNLSPELVEKVTQEFLEINEKGGVSWNAG